MFGNFAVGCGVMVVPGALNDLSRSLAVAPAVAGQLITAAAVAVGTGAPLLAAALGHWDRRRLLALAMAWYAAGHALAALAPDFTLLLPLRVAGVLGAAVFTPQAAAAINVLAPPAERGRAITRVFLGWSLSSVLGMPMGSFIAETLGWRWAFGAVALLSATAAAWVWRAVPDGVRPPPLSPQSWRSALTHPVLMAMVAVTALSGAGQFTLFSYFAPYYRQVLGASAAQVSGLFFWFGAFGLLGNLLLTRWVDRLGAARCVQIALALMALSLLAWPWARGPGAMVLVLVPWALGCFSSNSAQQARLSQSAPAYAPALLALNTSAIYVGQAAGAGGGGAILAGAGFGPLSWAGLAWMATAIALSAWVTRRMQGRLHA
ncbi:MAG: MFS transporter [Burkholderiales bacterium]|nr:MFS transporter [Burkholderiales bacterium]MDE2274787.1 MFS transporter [Burkholderiales bacterium]